MTAIHSTTGPWAKLRRACREGRGDACRSRCSCPETGRLSVIGHSADVAAVMLALLDIPTVAARLAALLGRSELTAGDRARLAALTALHDLGKVNIGFQRRPFDPRGISAGHIRPMLYLLGGDKQADAQKQRLLDARLRRFEHLTTYVATGSDRTWRPFQTVLAHHGSLPDTSSPSDVAPLWRAQEGYDPFAAAAALMDAIATWLPDALVPTPIAWSSPFAHAFAGLVTLADWLGSDASPSAFPFPGTDGAPDGVDRFDWARERAAAVVRRLWLAPDIARAVAAALPWEPRALIGYEDLSAAQEAVLSLAPPRGGTGRVCLIEDETGSGKTEAALIHFLDLFRRGAVDGMYFALPTRAAARQIHRRIEIALQRLIGPGAHVTLAVPGYLGRGPSPAALPDPGALYPDDAADRLRDARWAGERPKRYLASWVAVGTIDQVLLGGLRVRHAQLRSGAMLRLLLAIDEIHANDPHMTAILRNVLDQHVRAGGHALLMSATLGATARARFFQRTGRVHTPAFADAVSTPYPAVWTDGAAPLPATRTTVGRAKEVRVELEAGWSDERHVAARAVAAASRGARVLVIRNTVRLVVATQIALEALAPHLSFGMQTRGTGFVACPHHARFAPEDRALLDTALEASLGRDAPREAGLVVVASQTAEQSLDIDADLLITDLCPADVLLQRIGRLHRHRATARPPGFEQPAAVVLAPDEAALAAAIDARGEVRDAPLALGRVYPDLLGVLATRRALAERPVLRIPADNRALVEAATHDLHLRDLAAGLGGNWTAHWKALRGTTMAAAVNVKAIAIDWCRPLQSLNEAQVAKTRIGLDDRVIALPDGSNGPFGAPIIALPLRADWVRGVPDDAEPATAISQPGQITIRLGERRFTYDRLGLQPVPQS